MTIQTNAQKLEAANLALEKALKAARVQQGDRIHHAQELDKLRAYVKELESLVAIDNARELGVNVRRPLRIHL